MVKRLLIVTLGLLVLLGARPLLALPDGKGADGARKSKPEIVAQLRQLETEIWQRSLACAGEAAVAPLQDQYQALQAELGKHSREPFDPLDQGGDVCTSSTVIPSIPYTDSGTTAGYADNYATPCYPGGAAPDVVYRFTPTVDMTLDVSLCGSSYNTVLSIWLGCPGSDEPVMLCCNDDSPDCAPQSCCSGFQFTRNVLYFIIIDGAAGESGSYQLVMDYSVMPACFVGLGCVVCPPGANYETEACPATFPDPNAGPACAGSGYELLNCGETMCGKITHTSTWQDKDAYYLTLHQRDSVRWCIVSEFPVLVQLYEYFPG